MIKKYRPKRRMDESIAVSEHGLAMLSYELDDVIPALEEQLKTLEKLLPRDAIEAICRYVEDNPKTTAGKHRDTGFAGVMNALWEIQYTLKDIEGIVNPAVETLVNTAKQYGDDWEY